MSTTKIEVYATLLKVAKTETLKRMVAVPEEKRLVQFESGKATPLWYVGHLAGSATTILVNWLLNEQGTMAPEQAGLFMGTEFGGPPITTNAADYPPWDDLVRMYEAAMIQAIEGLNKMDDNMLPNPLPGEMSDDFRSFFTSIETTLRIIVSHDAEHRGQLGMLSKYGK